MLDGRLAPQAVWPARAKNWVAELNKNVKSVFACALVLFGGWRRHVNECYLGYMLLVLIPRLSFHDNGRKV